MNKLIFRKLSLDILKFFLIASFCITFIVWIIQAVNYLDFATSLKQREDLNQLFSELINDINCKELYSDYNLEILWNLYLKGDKKYYDIIMAIVSHYIHNNYKR